MAFFCFLGIFIILLGLCHSVATAVEGVGNCPCEDSALCEPVTTQHKKEFLGFVTNEVPLLINAIHKGVATTYTS